MTSQDAVRSDPPQAPDPEDPRKPDSPTDLTKRSWFYLVRRTIQEFLKDQCGDAAAGLTYYSVLALFPAAIAVVSLVGVVGEAQTSVDTVLEVLDPLVSDSTLASIESVLDDIADSQTSGLLLIVGLVGAIWTASAYVGAFGRAMNRIYEVQEGRPVWKLRPWTLLLTLIMVGLMALSLVILALSGPLAESIGEQLGLDSSLVQTWAYAKWPVLLVAVIFIVALLYYGTPNVKQPKFRWLSPGAVLAIGGAALASAGFTFYVTNFGSYGRTYGSLAGAIVGLLLLWILNMALLFGAELDSELERARQLQAGVPAEERIQLPVRDDRNIEKRRRQAAKDAERGRRLREQASTPWPPPLEPDERTTEVKEKS